MKLFKMLSKLKGLFSKESKTPPPVSLISNHNDRHPTFSCVPLTRGEQREKHFGAKEWETRDALISVLREIDSGEFKTKNCLLILENEDETWIKSVVSGCHMKSLGLAAFYISTCYKG